MVKTLTFDLHFMETVIQPLTALGWEFCQGKGYGATPAAYRAAVDSGLHVRFENSRIRDRVSVLKST